MSTKDKEDVNTLDGWSGVFAKVNRVRQDGFNNLLEQAMPAQIAGLPGRPVEELFALMDEFWHEGALDMRERRLRKLFKDALVLEMTRRMTVQGKLVTVGYVAQKNLDLVKEMGRTDDSVVIWGQSYTGEHVELFAVQK